MYIQAHDYSLLVYRNENIRKKGSDKMKQRNYERKFKKKGLGNETKDGKINKLQEKNYQKKKGSDELMNERKSLVIEWSVCLFCAFRTLYTLS